MSQKIFDERTVKLHRAVNGDIWWADGVYPPKNSGLQLDPFLATINIFGKHASFRLIGVPNNAELISSLYLCRHRGDIASLEVAGPNSLLEYDENDVEKLLLSARRICMPAACGGWHSVSFYDYSCYSLIARLARNKSVVDDFAAGYLRVHPVFKSLLFINELGTVGAAQVIASLIDPRWFVDSRRPESQTKINLYFGLTPKIQKNVSSVDYVVRRSREVRCAYVLSAWKTKNPADVNLADPKNFLYRVWYASGGAEKGDLRASQYFLQYLRQNWLAAISARRGPKDGLFAPDLFFKMPDEVEAYLDHMSVTEKDKNDD
jgi:hypothetical protein